MGNELKLSLENFQSISHGELIFHAGTNVIIGQSNSGKTATFRGLKACLSNPLGSQRFIKKGTSKTSVALEYNGNQIIWKRTPKESSYTINGEDFIKTGKSSAFKLVDDLGFVVDDNDTIMNIEEELQLPFPFGISKSELFKLYENVFCVSDSAVILKAAKETEEQTKSSIVTLEAEITKNTYKLEELANFRKEVNLDFLKEKRKYFKESSDRLFFLKDDLDSIHKAYNIQNFKVEENVFKNELIEYEELNQLKNTLFRLKKLHRLGKDLKEIVIPETIDLSLYKDLKELYKICNKLSEIKNITILEKEFSNKLSLYNELKKLHELCIELFKIKDIKAIEKEFSNKLSLYNELKEYSLFIQNLKKSIKEKKIKLENTNELIKQKEEKLKEFKVCPLCHKPLD